MWTLIIWSMLCTSADTGCKTGDYIVLDKTHTHITLCERAGESWKKLVPATNRYYCSWTADFERFKL